MTKTLLLPLIAKGNPVVPTNNIPMFLNQTELNLAALMTNDPHQNRKELVIDQKLCTVARYKANDMAAKGYAGHTDPNGMGPNRLAESTGYKLPDWYDQDEDANNIESIAYGGYGIEQSELASRFWKTLTESEFHRVHLLGLDDFYRGQTQLGIGYCFDEDSEHKHYLCIMTSHRT